MSEYYVDSYSIEDLRDDLCRVVEYFKEQEWHENAMQVALIEGRQLSPEIVKECDAFFIPEDLTMSQIPDWIKSEPIGLVRYKKFLYYAGRIVYPVKDVKGKVMGFCGWDPFEEPKYLDSRNYGYKAKDTTLFGMEKLPEYYASGKPVFVTEGIVCCLYLRSLGYQALALLGSHATPYVLQILSRFKDKLILVPDNDEAGNSLVKQAKWNLKKCLIIQCKVGKDIDGMRKFEEHSYEKDLQEDLKLLTTLPFCNLKTFIRR